MFLEAFLGELADKLGLPKPNASQDDLNGRIEKLVQCSVNHNPTQPDVQNTRERLVYDIGLTTTTVAEDAAFICRGLGVILDWYRTIRLDDPHPANLGGYGECPGVGRARRLPAGDLQ